MKALRCQGRYTLMLAMAGLAMLLAAGCQSARRAAGWDMHEPWTPPTRLADFELPHDAPQDAALQAQLAALDASVGDALGIPPERRAFGVLDLNELRYAAVRPDAEFYGASVPKICIVAGYFEKFPEKIDSLDAATQRELELVIKRSDNDLAAKYSQIAGLDFLQAMVTGARYRLYDEEHGGGLWVGKHYGVEQPRIGDPLHDHSHAATVRQCLRYYLMLEQNRLVSPAACDRLREIFAAPRLEFHDQGVVRGLDGRRVTLIRKSGTWEEWHLDTARVRHGERVYLLAGMTEHGKGDDYIQRMCAGVDEILCGPDAAPPPFIHRTQIHERAEDFRAGTIEGGKIEGEAVLLGCCGNPGGAYTSPVIDSEIWFNDAVLSWNVATAGGAGFVVEMRVGRGYDDFWSPWLLVGDWGATEAFGVGEMRFEGGRIDVDYFRSKQRYDRVQYRIRAARGPNVETLRLERFGVCLSDTSGIPLAVATVPQDLSEPHIPAGDGDWRRALPVPARSQKAEQPDISGRICSPTSLSMVMAYRGVDRPTGDVAGTCLDPRSGIYGNWPRNVQAAFAWGVPGYLTRFSDWAAVERMIAAGRPLIISVRVKEPGELAGAPYKTTDGHLIVLRGFEADGDVLVNDPAVSDVAAVPRVYRRADLERVWMRGSGGLTYVLTEPAGSGQ